MRTVIELDNALASQAAKLAGERGCDLPHFIEEAVREKVAKAPGNPLVAPNAFGGLTTVGGSGLRPGVNLDDSAALFDLMDRPA